MCVDYVNKALSPNSEWLENSKRFYREGLSLTLTLILTLNLALTLTLTLTLTLALTLVCTGGKRQKTE